MIATKSELVLTSEGIDVAQLQPCNHEEADSCIMLYLAHASKQGHHKAYVRTVDNDVVVVAVSLFQQLQLQELWIGLGCGKSYKDIPVHKIQVQLGPQKSLMLGLFHALSGCNTTSQMLGIGKKTA